MNNLKKKKVILLLFCSVIQLFFCTHLMKHDVLFLLFFFINLASVYVYDFHPWFYDFDQSLFFFL